MLLPALHAVLQTAEQAEASVLDLAFPDPQLRTALQLSGGQVVGLRSGVLPPWSVSLIRHGVHPVAVAEAQQAGGQAGSKLHGALSFLVTRGYLSRAEVTQVAQERVLAALLPIAWQTATATTAPWTGGLPAQPLNGGDARQGVYAAEQHAAHLNEQERALRPSDRLIAAPLAPLDSSPDDADAAGQVYRAALRGLSLGETAQRLPLRWDTLAQTVTRLVDQGALRPQDAAAPRVVAGQLQPGQVAPDFCLPDLAGGEVRLRELRGAPVWLVFNRQSTCAMCNPHNAQIIALHERLREKGVRVVTVWGSTLADLEGGIGRQRPPYPVLADPRDETYDRYGLSMSLRGTLDPRNLPTMLQGFRMMGAKALKDDGELLRMPAEFLIGAHGRIDTAHYNSYGSDWLPLERVLAWADGQG